MRTARTPLIAFVGTTPNIGTSYAAFAAACRIAGASEASVGYLCMNLKSAKLHRYIGVDRPASTLDLLRPELRSYSLRPDKLRQSAHRVEAHGDLSVLFGNLMRDQAEFYSPEEMDHLLDTALDAFDVVVADVGAYWDNAATLCALRRADSRIVVTTTALSHFQEDGHRWIKQLSPLYGIPGEYYEALIIHPPWRSGGFHVKEICNELGVPFIGELKLTEPGLSQLDSGSLDEWLAENEQGRQAMAEPARKLMSRYALKKRAGIAMQPWYKKLLTHRDGVRT